MKEYPYYVLAYYSFEPLADPHAEVAAHKAFFASRDVTCRIYISEQGINGQMSASRQHALEYMEWMQNLPQFQGLHFKISGHHENVFPRATVKYRKQLVAIDDEVDLSKKGEYLSPQRWREMLDKDERHLLLDVRNEYEWKIGHFQGADLPACETFREFKCYADQLKEKVDPKETPVMMYCTGGIRCELYSSILKEKGFEKVYQLEGGVINYGLKEGQTHWLGKLFVFDDRLAVPIADEEPVVISECHHCKQPSDTYYNCANMDCNMLFLCCAECLGQYQGCCKEACCSSPRLRPYQPLSHKPFRRRHHYSQE